MDPEVAAVMSVPPYTAIAAGLHHSPSTTDLDRYVRTEFGDRQATWLADGVGATHSEHASCESDDDGRLLQRLTQAIASFF